MSLCTPFVFFSCDNNAILCSTILEKCAVDEKLLRNVGIESRIFNTLNCEFLLLSGGFLVKSSYSLLLRSQENEVIEWNQTANPKTFKSKGENSTKHVR